MANVLGQLFQDIADAIRTKTGDTATMKPAEFPQAIAAITGGGGSGESVTTLLAEQTVEFNESGEAYHGATTPLVTGKTYTVVWNGTEYECEAFGASPEEGVTFPAIGNSVVTGGADNGMPFVILYMSAEFAGSDQYGILAIDGSTSATVAIYQQASSGGSAETLTTIFEEQTLDGFALDETFGAYAYHISPAPFTLTLDETYIVEWDGVTYTCPAQNLSAFGEGHLGLGELAHFGGSGNGEPFVIGWSASGVSIFAGDTETSHTLAIYQQASSSGGDSEAVFSCHNRSYTDLMKLSSTTTLTPELTLTLPAGSKVQNVASTSMTCGAYTLSTSAKTPTGAVVSPNDGNGTTTVTEGEGGVVVTTEFSSEIWGNFYFAGFYSQTVFFTLPGIYTRVNGDGTATLYADESATVWQPSATPVTAPEIIDLSQSAITALPDYFCYKLPNVTRVILPGAVTSIGQYAFQSAPDLTVVDASGCTAVPALGANAFTAAEGLQILVPAALYDEWVAAANWSGYAQYIVAV